MNQKHIFVVVVLVFSHFLFFPESVNAIPRRLYDRNKEHAVQKPKVKKIVKSEKIIVQSQIQEGEK